MSLTNRALLQTLWTFLTKSQLLAIPMFPGATEMPVRLLDLSSGSIVI